MSKKYLSILFLVFVLIPACSVSQAAETPDAAGDTGDTSDETGPVVIRIGKAGSPDSINPGKAQITYAYEAFELVYDSMYQLNLDGTFSLELAESVDVSDDGTVWTFHIRDGFTWHDGETLTAEDIAFTYNFYQSNPEFPFMPAYTEYFTSVEAPDDSTVVITLSKAIPNMESRLIWMYILPEHIWGSLEGNPSEFENLEMVGSGPFKLIDYTPDEFLHFEAIGEHPLYAPNVDEVIIQKFDNHDALAQALRTGQVDMITEMSNTAVASLKSEADIAVVSGPFFYPTVLTVFFNQVEDADCPPEDGVCSGHPALRDRQVRLALAHATDKQKLLDVVLLGFGDPGLTLVPSGIGAFYNDSLADYAFDVALANTILDDAGYLDVDGDGMREMPDGSRSLRFRMNYQDDMINSPRLSDLLKEMWAEVGVAVEIQGLEFGALRSVCCPTFDYDVILWGWSSEPDPGFLLFIMATDAIPIGNNETGYSNPAYDALFIQQQSELNKEKRNEIIWEMQRIVLEDVVYIIPFYPHAVQAYRTDRFTGWPIIEGGRLALESLISLVVIEPVK